MTIGTICVPNSFTEEYNMTILLDKFFFNSGFSFGKLEKSLTNELKLCSNIINF